MIDKIQEKIDKYEILEREAGNRAEFNMIGEFLGDLGKLLESAKEKKKACCAAKASPVTEVAGKLNERWIHVTKCRYCPSMFDPTLVDPYCTKTLLCIDDLDVIHPFCDLDKTPTRPKEGV